MSLDGCVTLDDVEDVLLHILLHHIPRTATQAKSLALSDGVEPVALVLAEHLARLNVDDIAFLFTQKLTNIVVVVQLTQETDALRVLAAGIHQMLPLSDGAHLFLPHVADGEQRLAQLPVVELCQEVGLVLHGVGTRAKPLHSLFVDFRLGIVSRGDEVILMAALAVESTELN